MYYQTNLFAPVFYSEKNLDAQESCMCFRFE